MGYIKGLALALEVLLSTLAQIAVTIFLLCGMVLAVQFTRMLWRWMSG